LFCHTLSISKVNNKFCKFVPQKCQLFYAGTQKKKQFVVQRLEEGWHRGAMGCDGGWRAFSGD
jgi:hypothetical protein